jgi:hypothetical protein
MYAKHSIDPSPRRRVETWERSDRPKPKFEPNPKGVGEGSSMRAMGFASAARIMDASEQVVSPLRSGECRWSQGRRNEYYSLRTHVCCSDVSTFAAPLSPTCFSREASPLAHCRSSMEHPSYPLIANSIRLLPIPIQEPGMY